MQLVPFMGSGSGVAGVAWNLDREFRALGVEVESFTYEDALQGRPAHRMPKGRLRHALAVTGRMMWFLTVGTRRAKRYLAERPGAVSICHNDLLVGDIYVNHGLVVAAMRARGHALWRMLRNPTHPFTFFRDLYRYHSRAHRVVVALSNSEVTTLKETFGGIRPRVVVIPNGVDFERFHLPSADERAQARAEFQLGQDDRVALFVGHEFERKGLDLAIEALVHAPTVLLLVVGGIRRTILDAGRQAETLGVADRVLFLGPRGDVPHLMAASDMFLMPSYYESSGLVYLEALACGLPVVSTRVGIVPEVVVDGVNGYLVERDPALIGDRLEVLAAADLTPWRERAHTSVESYSWRAIAQRYVDLAVAISEQPPAERV
ncbi:glycosyltransferase family 4 protein [Raineyella fluvialis]|uniref:Glycosyltransferase n=1 Tax=Raineyella fluvialis TaxID=2662261 RepID=A0A5Q2FEI0_9ACTN|nr:glycosyltransferase family 4 protein [Raineyella fluvialis]QGF23894.1 glycosyltransferase [Raineyella fluvialis]